MGFFLWPDSLVETEIFVPVEIVNLSHKFTITGLNIKGFEATVKGSRTALKKLAEHKLRYPADLANAAVGLLNIPIRTDTIQLPRGLEITQIKPSFLTGTIVETQSKSVPVKIKATGKPAPGFEITAITAKPAAIVLRGAENSLNIESITTKPIDISGLSETFRIETALDHADSPNVIAEPNVIMAEIVIHEQNVVKEFKGIPVEGKNGVHPFSITPAVLDIKVKGPVNAINKLDLGNDLKVYVDLKGLKSGVYVRRAVIALPVQLMLVRVKPEVFTVKIGK
ncbi:CdaR family protein [Desulfococcaceae bacterium HSG9]|nr:CdaR family protein [Desulfococcaceae bacterium HSG9]